ncbi:MAG TPA: DUF4258 domain-containing protein [Bacteroidales bacterium]|nr:DUF4258 domain-containing protein [Bacteroidales bacterium]
MEYIISKHCLEQIRLRGIIVDEINSVLKKPDLVLKQGKEIAVYQALTFDRNFLIRIFVNTLKQPNLVITAYKTSKISKYHEDKI